ncbi:MAG: LysM peptidoglycan-binding domain-containing protein [Bacillota bacterium]
MDLYLINPKEDTAFRFPVNPEEISVATETLKETIEITNIGEVDFPWGDKRAEIRFSCFLPYEYDVYCQYPSIPDPVAAAKQLEAWRKAKQPLRFIVTDSPINGLVYIVSFNTQIIGGAPGDIYFDIVLRTWQETKVRTAAEIGFGLGAGVSTVAARPDTKPVPGTYTVKAGDSLWKIAKMQLGDGAKWKQIYEANREVIGPDPNLIKPGQQLVMP